MTILVCGSLAYDNIMSFHDRFSNHILPEQIHILNVAFHVPEMRREFGGCAGNIAYSLKLLGNDPLIMATVGEDADPYLKRLDELGLSGKHVRRIADSYTAQAFITTDLDDNQITAFHPGAMSFSHQNSVLDADHVTLAIVAPDGREGMIKHAADLAEAGIPFIFDPGQGMTLFSGEELRHFLSLASYACFNDYEAKLLCERTNGSLEQFADKLKALVITRGGEGSRIYADSRSIDIPCVKAESVIDPTGCGDAYRAGLLYGIDQGWDWEKTGQLAAIMGAFKVACRGGQNHHPSRNDIADCFRLTFGQTL